MKKYIFIIAATTAITSCLGGGVKPVEQKENEKVASATWDYYVVGSWHYIQTTEEGRTPDKYVEGVESFLGNGDYINHCVTADSSKVVLKGFWAIDPDKDYTINIYLQKKSDGNKVGASLDHKLVYTVVSLEPEVQFNYTFDGNNRHAFRVKE
ncbi:MAG: hypothetical protein J5784_03295 [Muribaculaceae bacterium]|nr:hypothetical protein [Muribaculaceae bacterium]